MLATVVAVVVTHNLAIGVAGRRAAVRHLLRLEDRADLPRHLRRCPTTGRRAPIIVEGQLFFASADDFNAAFDFKEALEKVTIDVSRAHIWDISSVAALDIVILKFRREGAEVEIIGLNEASETIVDKLAIHDKPGAMERLMGH